MKQPTELRIGNIEEGVPPYSYGSIPVWEIGVAAPSVPTRMSQAEVMP